jgi:predicted nucleic acid-binding Zn ribbon protein
MVISRKYCPVCGYGLLARENDDVFCLSQSCDWRTKSKRDEDTAIPEYQELKDSFN